MPISFVFCPITFKSFNGVSFFLKPHKTTLYLKDFSFFHIKHNLGQKVSKKMRKYFVKATFFME